MIVGGGVVLAASYEAKAFGVRTAMNGGQARRLCPGLIEVPPRMSAYSAASKAVFEVFRDTTPLVEGLSIDEAFLDVGGLGRVSGLQRRSQPSSAAMCSPACDCPSPWGSPVRSSSPRSPAPSPSPTGSWWWSPTDELEFLHPLPVERLWGVGKVTAEKLHARGITRVGEVARLPESTLIAMLGAGSGRHLHALAHNRDPRVVVTGRRRGSMGAQCALGRRRSRAPAELDAVLVGLVDRVTSRLRAANRVGRTVVLRLRFDDFSRVTRSDTLDGATAQTSTILHAARELLERAGELIEERGITLVGIAVANLHDADAVQLPLPFERRSRADLDTALDSVKERFGKSAVTRGVLLGRDTGFTVPMLPD